MLHHILVKWKEKPADPAALNGEIEALFRQALSIPGVQGVEVIPNVVDRPNRYDLMIRLTMDTPALTAYVASEAQHRWKELYGPLIAQKAIERQIGARGLRAIMEKIMTSIMFLIPSDLSIQKIVITPESVEGGDPVIVRDAAHPRQKLTGKK